MRILEITPQTLRLLQDKINEALKPLGTEYGVSLRAEGGKYGSGYGELKVQIGIVTADGETITKEATDFKLYAMSHGLQPGDLGKVITGKGKPHTIKGFVLRSRKILTETPDGRQWTWRVEAIKAALAEVQS